MSSQQDRHEQWAVFWCSLLAPLLYGEIPVEEAGPFLRQLTETECEFPDGTRRKPARATLWRKWKKYRDGGFEALFPKRRCDRGKPRRATQAMQGLLALNPETATVVRADREIKVSLEEVRIGDLFRVIATKERQA